MKEKKPIKVIKVGKAESFGDFIQSMTDKARLAEETHKQNGGMCQHCGKEKAEYPNGFNPYNCAKCNAETQRIVHQLQKGGGFNAFRMGARHTA